MELKPGYKLTDVGVIPEEWHATKLSELAILKTGPFGSLLHKSDYCTDGVPLVNPIHIIDGRIVPDRKTTLAPDVSKRLSEFSLRDGDVVLARRGEMGRCAVVGPLEHGWLCGTGSLIVRTHGKLLPQFAQRVLSSPQVVSRIEDSSVGTTMVSLNHSTLAGLRLQCPPPTEQRAIAGALSDVDALIGALDQLIAKKRDLKQAAMQQLLTGHQRLPGFAPANPRFQQTDVGLIPEDWEAKAIGNDIDLLTGFPFGSSGYTTSGIRLLRGSNVKRGQTDWSDDLTQCWPAMTPDIVRYELRDGDLVIAMDGSLVGRSFARLKSEDVPAVLLQRVARIRSTRLDIGYLTAFVGSDWFVKYCDSVKTVTAIPHISAHDIRSFVIPVPPTLAEQTAIAEVLSDMDAELAALEQKRDKARLLKQGMMQELLTGRTRLVES